MNFWHIFFFWNCTKFWHRIADSVSCVTYFLPFTVFPICSFFLLCSFSSCRLSYTVCVCSSRPFAAGIRFRHLEHSSSSSISTAALVGYGLLNYPWVFSAGRFLQGVVASGTSNLQLGGPVIRTFQPPPGVRHVWNDASEPQQRKVELWARNYPEFCRKWRLPRHFWVHFEVLGKLIWYLKI